MSWYQKDEFEYVFASRTLKNLEFIETEYQKEKAQGKTDQEIDSVFEVTQLLNSFVGFIVLPRAQFFKNMSDDANFKDGSKEYVIMQTIINDSNKCSNTYRALKYITKSKKRERIKEFERITPKTIILHMRNAISHNNISITPIRCGEKGSIDGFVFEDLLKLSYYYDGEEKIECNELQNFRLALSIEEIRVLVVALCKLMLNHYE